MKRFYKISGHANESPVRLMASIVLAFAVMLFINGFIGSMGGIPALIAFVAVFYPLRTVATDGKRITHQISMTSRKEIRFFLVDYALGYILVWSIFRLGFLVSRVTGWGNINGTSAFEYIKEVLNTPILEKWAYLSAGIVMFAFVLSLFPLVVIREPARWLSYALADGAFFIGSCFGIRGICIFSWEVKEKIRTSCLIDSLLLCHKLNGWQEILCIAVACGFVVGIAFFVFYYSAGIYGPKPGCVDEEKLHLIRKKKKRGEKKCRLIAVVCGTVAVLAVAVTILFMPENTNSGYSKVAEYLTKDTKLGPMEYGGNIYVPVDGKMNLYQTGMPQGYLAGKDEKCGSRFYRLAVADLLYTDVSGNMDYVQVHGANERIYEAINRTGTKKQWGKNSVFLLWDEDWSRESAYSHEPTGYTTCNYDLIQGLRMQFPEVVYRAADFSDYDAYFTIRAYSDMDQVLEDNSVSGEWAGCILVKKNKFYFGNYDNEITGICRQQLRKVLGGNLK